MCGRIELHIVNSTYPLIGIHTGWKYSRSDAKLGVQNMNLQKQPMNDKISNVLTLRFASGRRKSRSFMFAVSCLWLIFDAALALKKEQSTLMFPSTSLT